MSDKNPNLGFQGLLESMNAVELNEETLPVEEARINEVLTSDERKAINDWLEPYDARLMPHDSSAEDDVMISTKRLESPEQFSKLQSEAAKRWPRFEWDQGGDFLVGNVKESRVDEAVRQRRKWYPDGTVEEEIEWDEDHHMAAMADGAKLPESLVKENAEELIAKFVQSEHKKDKDRYTVEYGGQTYTGESVDDLIEQLTSKGPDESKVEENEEYDPKQTRGANAANWIRNRSRETGGWVNIPWGEGVRFGLTDVVKDQVPEGEKIVGDPSQEWILNQPDAEYGDYMYEPPQTLTGIYLPYLDDFQGDPSFEEMMTALKRANESQVIEQGPGRRGGPGSTPIVQVPFGAGSGPGRKDGLLSISVVNDADPPESWQWNLNILVSTGDSVELTGVTPDSIETLMIQLGQAKDELAKQPPFKDKDESLDYA